MTATENQLSARRALRAIFLMQGQVFEGVRLQQLAEALQCSPSTTLRTLEVLADEGVAERIPGREQHWRLTPRMIQLARAVELAFAEHVKAIDEFKARYSRTPS
jgi:DNA-binding IclR family transcriptional regulator